MFGQRVYSGGLVDLQSLRDMVTMALFGVFRESGRKDWLPDW